MHISCVLIFFVRMKIVRAGEFDGNDRAKYELFRPLERDVVIYRLCLLSDRVSDLYESDHHYCRRAGFCVTASYLDYGFGRRFESFNTTFPNGPHKFLKIVLPSGCPVSGYLYQYTDAEGMKKLSAMSDVRKSTDAFGRDMYIRESPFGRGYVVDSSDHYVGRLPRDAIITEYRNPEACFDLHVGVLEVWSFRRVTAQHYWIGAVDRARSRGVLPLEYETNEELALYEAIWLACFVYYHDFSETQVSENVRSSVFLSAFGFNELKDGRFGSTTRGPVDSLHGYYSDAFCRKLVSVCPALQFCSKIGGSIFRSVCGDDVPAFVRSPRVEVESALDYVRARETALPEDFIEFRDRPFILCDYATLYVSRIRIVNHGMNDPRGFAAFIAKTGVSPSGISDAITKLVPTVFLEECLSDSTLLESTGYEVRGMRRYNFCGVSEGLRRKVYGSVTLPSIFESDVDGLLRITNATGTREGFRLKLCLNEGDSKMHDFCDQVVESTNVDDLKTTLSAFFECVDGLEVQESEFKRDCKRIRLYFDDALDNADTDEEFDVYDSLFEMFQKQERECSNRFLIGSILSVGVEGAGVSFSHFFL